MADEKEKTAEELWAEELAKDEPAELKLSQDAQGTSTNGENLGSANEPGDHGAAGLMDAKKPEAAAAPPAAAAPAKEKTVEEQLNEMRDSMQADFDKREKALKDELAVLRSAQGQQAAAAAAVAAASAPSKEQIKEAGKTSAKWEALKAEFPEWVEAMEERLEALKPEAAAAPDFTAERERLTGEIAKARTEIRDELTSTMENRFVERVHRGWKKIITTPEFVEWYSKQDADTRKLGASPVAEDAIELLDRYKAHRESETSDQRTQETADDLKSQNRERLARASTAPNGQRGSGKQGGAKAPEDMTAEEYWNHLVAQDESKAKT